MKKLAYLIVETRKVNLIKIINDHLRFLPEGDLFIRHGREHRFLKTIFPKANIVEILSEFNENSYNRILVSDLFWKQFLDYDRVLIFQHDSGILREGIEEFMEFDYIGASWAWNSEFPGNGGISLRNPKIMHEICTKFPWNGQLNEDHWICMHMHQFKIGKLATIEEADKFSVEQKAIMGSWAYHALNKWHPEETCNKILNQYL